MRFTHVDDVRIPKGSAKRIRRGDKVLWCPPLARYVSLGDSIAAGHTINADWEKDYGTRSQYGQNGRKETVIVPNCYTDLIRQDLAVKLGGKVATTSFARSGDKVGDLIEKLDHDVVRKAVAGADYVTISIGANNVLGPSLDHMEEYLLGDGSALNTIKSEIDVNLAALADDNNANSYIALFNKLSAINPNAQYVFTTIYNPYKYLWIEEGENGFFKPLLDTIPDITILGFDIDAIIKDQFLQVDIIEQLYDRVNTMGVNAEDFVTRLNTVLRDKITAYGKTNFMLADTKTLFEVFPDRPISAQKHYNDLVNVEFTRGFDVAEADWGELYAETDAATFWLRLATKYTSLSGLDMGGLMAELLPQIIEKVILPDIDPHPEEYGHYALKRSFEDVFGLQALDRHTLSYNANGGSGTMASQTIVGVDGLPAFTNLQANIFSPGTEGYYYNGWNTAADGSGTSYSNTQFIGIASNITLFAQWSNIFKITYKHTNKTTIYTDDETGHMECYALWIDGWEAPDLGKFNENRVETYYYPYGTRVGVVVSGYNPSEITYDDADTDIYWNGVSVAQGYGDSPATYEFDLTSDVTIEFQWKIAGSIPTFNAKSWEDCYITT